METTEKVTRNRVVITDINQVSGNRISRSNALNLMKNSKGRFFTVIFTKKDGTSREINCQYLKDQSDSELGYVKVQKRAGKAPKDKIRNINLQTMRSLSMSGKILKVG